MSLYKLDIKIRSNIENKNKSCHIKSYDCLLAIIKVGRITSVTNDMATIGIKYLVYMPAFIHCEPKIISKRNGEIMKRIENPTKEMIETGTIVLTSICLHEP